MRPSPSASISSPKTTSGVAWLGSYFRNTWQGLTLPFASAAAHGSLLWVLLRRDIASRGAGTLLGGAWPLLQTALQVLGFWFLFDVIYGARLNAGPSFLDYLLVGILPWLCLVEVLNRACNMLHEFSPLYRRNPFPLELLPVLVMLMPAAIYTLVYAGVNLWLGGPLLALASLPVIPLLLLWLLPFCLLLPVVGVFLKDLAQTLPFLLTMGLYATPILYFPDMLPESVQSWMRLNPFADIMALIHGLLQDMPVSRGNLLRPLILWLLLLGPCWLLFRRSLPHVREVL